MTEFVKELICDECGGKLVPTGMAFYTCPLKYEFKCEVCESKEVIPEAWSIPVKIFT